MKISLNKLLILFIILLGSLLFLSNNKHKNDIEKLSKKNKEEITLIKENLSAKYTKELGEINANYEESKKRSKELLDNTVTLNSTINRLQQSNKRIQAKYSNTSSTGECQSKQCESTINMYSELFSGMAERIGESSRYSVELLNAGLECESQYKQVERTHNE